MSFHFHSLIQSVIAKFKGPRGSQAWQCALAGSTALALLASLLWLAPWQGWHDGPATVPQSMPLQGSDRTTEETARPTVQPPVAPSSAPRSDVGLRPSAPAPQNPEQPHISATAEEPTAVRDTQARQGLATGIETTRSHPEEDVDTRAMDRLLARLASVDQMASPPSKRSKAARKRGTRVPPGVGHRRAPGSVSPPRIDSASLRAASGMPFRDAPR